MQVSSDITSQMFQCFQNNLTMLTSFSKGELRRSVGGSERIYGRAAWKAQRLTCHWCDSPCMPRIKILKSNKTRERGKKGKRIRWSDSALPDISFLYATALFKSALNQIANSQGHSWKTGLTFIHPPTSGVLHQTSVATAAQEEARFYSRTQTGERRRPCMRRNSEALLHHTQSSQAKTTGSLKTRLIANIAFLFRNPGV